MVMFLTGGVFAQMAPPQTNVKTDYSDDELKQFVQAANKVMTIQEEGQVQMVNIIEENEMNIDRFNELIMEAQTQGPENITASEDEKASFNNTLNEVQTLQMKLQEDMVATITNEGLDIQQYQSIMQAYETDAEVKEKVDAYFAEHEE